MSFVRSRETNWPKLARIRSAGPKRIPGLCMYTSSCNRPYTGTSYHFCSLFSAARSIQLRPYLILPDHSLRAARALDHESLLIETERSLAIILHPETCMLPQPPPCLKYISISIPRLTFHLPQSICSLRQDLSPYCAPDTIPCQARYALIELVAKINDQLPVLKYVYGRL